MRFDVAVGGVDSLYIDALVRYLLVSEQNNFIVMTVYDCDQLVVLMTEKTGLCALVDEALFHALDEGFVQANKERLLVLTEAVTEVNLRDVHSVFRYQKTSVIEQMLRRFLIESSAGELNGCLDGRCEVTCFYSPSGGVGTSTAALAAAMLKADSGGKTLFLSLDDYPGYDRLLNGGLSHSLTDYIVYMKGRDNWFLGLEGMVSTDGTTGLNYLQPMMYQLDRYEMQPSDWVTWLEYIRDHSDYDSMVIDLSSGGFQENLAWLKACDLRVYLIGCDDTGSAKWDRFEEQIKAMDEEMILDRAVRLTSDLMPRSGRTCSDTDTVFPYDPNIITRDGDGKGRLNLRSRSVTRLKEVISHV